MDELVARHKRVRMINRSGRANLPAGVELMAGDAADLAFARKAAEGASVVYNALNPAYYLWPELFPKLQAGVLEGAAAAGARLVVMENLYMYGDPHGQPITEDLPYVPHTRKGRVRAAMSRALIEAHEQGRVKVAIGRASDFFGPRSSDQSPLGNLVIGRALTDKSAQVIGHIDMPHTYSYVPDIGKALVTLGEREEALGQAWHIPSPPTVTTRQIVEMIFRELGQPPRIQIVPRPLLRLMGLFDRNVAEIWEMLYEFEQPFVLDHSKYVRAFGDHATPLSEALRTTIAWFRQPAAQAA
ncbi:MAG: NAD-dependent epimerase/dehydratase family protein [Anaerolineae bacterium]|nr:NAD-dependent epimerase/dehydratase family protein [Anaerolineae bacterium]